MTKMTSLLERDRQFAAACAPGPLGPPAEQVVIVTRLDHRVDPAISAPSRIRTCGLLLRRHFRAVGGRCWPWPHVLSSCTDCGWPWHDVALCLAVLAPRL